MKGFNLKTSKRSQVSSFLVMDIMREASLLEADGNHIIHMEVGQPSTGASKEALLELRKKMLTDNLGYSLALGLPELRKGISKLYKNRYQLDIEAERVIITSGSSAAFILAFTAFFDCGDNVLVGEPGYPSYKNILKSLNLLPELTLTNSSSKFQLTKDDILKSNSKGVLIASPSNPTGTSLKASELKSLINAAKQRNMTFISDEIYHGLNFDSKDTTALEFDNNSVVINSFSKYYSMTGWRLGWMVVPKEAVRTIEKLIQNLFICPSHASQLLGLYSLKYSKPFQDNVEEYKTNRDILMKNLPHLGFQDIVKPDGAFYIYANISKFQKTSEVLVKEILNKTGVAITPGNDFDTTRGHDTVRFSYSCSTSDVKDAVKRLALWCKTLNI